MERKKVSLFYTVYPSQMLREKKIDILLNSLIILFILLKLIWYLLFMLHCHVFIIIII